jgi:hypothetical protein
VLTRQQYESFQVVCSCGSNKVHRDYEKDLDGLVGAVRKHSSELKTIGDIAARNRDTYSDDQKLDMKKQHFSYLEEGELPEPPKGATRIKKSEPVKWTDTPTKKRPVKKRDKNA